MRRGQRKTRACGGLGARQADDGRVETALRLRPDIESAGGQSVMIGKVPLNDGQLCGVEGGQVIGGSGADEQHPAPGMAVRKGQVQS